MTTLGEFDLDSRACLEQAMRATGLSRYAFAIKVGMSPGLLARYLEPPEKGGSQMTAKKLKDTLARSGIEASVVFKTASSDLRADSRHASLPRKRAVVDFVSAGDDERLPARESRKRAHTNPKPALA